MLNVYPFMSVLLNAQMEPPRGQGHAGLLDAEGAGVGIEEGGDAVDDGEGETQTVPARGGGPRRPVGIGTGRCPLTESDRIILVIFPSIEACNAFVVELGAGHWLPALAMKT